MTQAPPLPRTIATIDVPHDEVSAVTWRWASRALPRYLFAHSVRAYCWGAAIAAGERIAFDPRVLWTSALLHDYALTTLPRNSMCFEVEGAEFARRFLERAGLPAELAERVAIAIILHMQPDVTLDDGPEALLLDRATAIDVRGIGFELLGDVRSGVIDAFPRGDFDRRFLDAIAREAADRPTCQSARLLGNGLEESLTRSPWRALET